MLLADAARLLTKNKVDCLPVTQEDGTLVGILTAFDFIELSIGFLDANETTRTQRSATT